MPPPATAPVTLTFRLDAATPLTEVMDVLLTITNDREVLRREWLKTPVASLTLPFHDGPGDAYRLVASVRGYHDTGDFVHADPHTNQSVALLLIPNHAEPQFPLWADLLSRYPVTAKLIAAGVSDSAAPARYADLAASKPLALASLMNLSAAMQRLVIGGQHTPLDFIREVIWDNSLAQDRFFAWTDPAIVPLVRAAATEHQFREEVDPNALHAGATCSFKQVQFDYANVQLTFHENDHRTIGTEESILMEPDMDLYKELVAHGIAEVIPNRLTNGHTNPLAVLALRWIDAVQSDEPLFDPGYTLSKAV